MGVGTTTHGALRARVAATFSHQLHTGERMSARTQAVLIVFSALLFGFQFVAFKEAFHAMGPWTLLALRAVLSIPVLYALMRWTGVTVRAGRAELLRIALPAALLLGSQAAFMVGVHRLSAGLTSTLFSVSPLVTLALGIAFRVERVAWIGVLGASAGVVGVAIATGATSSSVDVVGVLIVLGSNVLYALSFIAIKRMATPVSSGVYLLVMMVESVLALAPAAILKESFAIDLSWRSALALAYIVVLGQVIAYVAVLALLRFGGAFQSMLVTPLIPVFAIFFAVLLLGEPLLGRELAGGALIIGGVVAAILPRRPRSAAAP